MEEFISSDICEVNSRFKNKKFQAVKVSESLQRVGYPERSERVGSCCDVLQFRHDINPCTHDVDPNGKLYYSFFCKDKLCPICNWRRSVKIFLQIASIMEKINTEKYKFLFLTLTVPNCNGEYLRSTINDLQYSWSKFMRKKYPKKTFLGYIKALEVTYNSSEDTYHPHLHVILAVSKSYGKRVYFSESTLLKWWQEATLNPDIKIIDIRKVYDKHIHDDPAASDYRSAVAELSKYPLKFPRVLNDQMIYTFASQLTGLRFVDYGGIFKDIKKQLSLDDSENGDLLHVDPSEEASRTAYCMITKFKWQVGVYNFIDAQYDTFEHKAHLV